MEPKPLITSRTFWAGALTMALSLAAIAADFWLLLGPEHMELVDTLYGPGTTAALGALMILLRVITRNPVR